MPRTRMWVVFYVALGVGLIAGILVYLVFFSTAYMVLHNPAIGLPVAAGIGLLIGLSFYAFFKLTLRV